MTNPVSSDADVAAILPVEYMQEETATVRDALIHAHAAQQEKYQDRAAYAAQQADIGRATGRFLAALARDRTYQRQAGETDDELFRQRVLAVPLAVTPEVICDAVNAILFNVGAGPCEYLESIADRCYANVTGGTGTCASVLGATPVNPTRLYREDGGPLNNRSPGGAWAFGYELGRLFVLRVPNLSALDSAVPTPWQASSTALARPKGVGSIFARASGGLQNQNFVYQSGSSALDTYRAIADTVTRLVGQSIRWMMISDSRL